MKKSASFCAAIISICASALLCFKRGIHYVETSTGIHPILFDGLFYLAVSASIVCSLRWAMLVRASIPIASALIEGTGGAKRRVEIIDADDVFIKKYLDYLDEEKIKPLRTSAVTIGPKTYSAWYLKAHATTIMEWLEEHRVSVTEIKTVRPDHWHEAYAL